MKPSDLTFDQLSALHWAFQHLGRVAKRTIREAWEFGVYEALPRVVSESALQSMRNTPGGIRLLSKITEKEVAGLYERGCQAIDSTK